MGMYNYFEDSLKDDYGWILLVTFIVYICSFMVSTYILCFEINSHCCDRKEGVQDVNIL